jgi:hypothetical protein
VDPKTNLGTSKMVLEDVRVVQAPDATKMNLDVHEELKIVAQNGQAVTYSGGSQIGLKIGNDFYTFTGDPSLSDAEREVQVLVSYQALKATQSQIDSGSYPFDQGQVIIRKPDGNGGWADETIPQLPEDASSLLHRAAQRLRAQWDTYHDTVTDTQVEVKTDTILNIDLSKFTSGTSRTIIMYYIET